VKEIAVYKPDAQDFHKIDEARQKQKKRREIQEREPAEKSREGKQSAEDRAKGKTSGDISACLEQACIEPTNQQCEDQKAQVTEGDQAEKLVLGLDCRKIAGPKGIQEDSMSQKVEHQEKKPCQKCREGESFHMPMLQVIARE